MTFKTLSKRVFLKLWLSSFLSTRFAKQIVLRLHTDFTELRARKGVFLLRFFSARLSEIRGVRVPKSL